MSNDADDFLNKMTESVKAEQQAAKDGVVLAPWSAIGMMLPPGTKNIKKPMVHLPATADEWERMNESFPVAHRYGGRLPAGSDITHIIYREKWNEFTPEELKEIWDEYFLKNPKRANDNCSKQIRMAVNAEEKRRGIPETQWRHPL